jgi:hypothetical protein
MKAAIVTAAALALAALSVLAGCGGREPGKAPSLEDVINNTNEGSYQVKTVEDGEVAGVGIYKAGSFRIMIEGSPRVIIHNEASGDNWQINLAEKTYETITYDQAVIRASFMPNLEMKPYFQLQQFWQGDQFRMDTSDGRSITAEIGDDGLPVSWQAAAQGKSFKTISWEYRHIGEVSQDNFEVPDGVKARG